MLKRLKPQKKILFFVVSVVLGIFVFSFTANAQSVIQTTPNAYDFGDIYQEDGIISTVVFVENTGDKDIEINRLSTSCGCTNAEMDMSDLSPGEKREILVSFDPMVHPDQSGPITRVVYLQTSDLVQPEIEIDITGNVITGTSGIENQQREIERRGIKSDKKVMVFFNEACGGCAMFIRQTLPEVLGEYGYEIVEKDYVNERENRKLLNEYNVDWDVPFELQSHIESFVDGRLLLGGHIPVDIMRYLLENPDSYDRLLVFQDKMHGEETDYKVWNFEGEIMTYSIEEPITTYLDEQREGKTGVSLSRRGGFWGMFGVVTSSAFLDGLNPCAFAVLLFFIAFLFSIKRTKRSIWKTGLVYIFGIFLAYLLIGVGIAQAIIISGVPHLMAYVGAYLVIGLGIIQLLGIVFPAFPIKLRIPVNSRATAEKWLYKATIPAAFVGGFIVGLCTFPCSGGIYVAIIGMLVASQTFYQGIGWMVWYNLIFVSPLVILLVLAANKRTTEKLQKWERKESIHAKIIVGVTMIVLGLIILLFFV